MYAEKGVVGSLTRHNQGLQRGGTVERQRTDRPSYYLHHTIIANSTLPDNCEPVWPQ